MSSLHPIAERGFGTDGERYESGRPGYPAEAVRWLIDQLAIDDSSAVADVGAGTGKLTRLLRPVDCRLYAIEPVPEMSDVLRRIDPSIEVIAATAAELPFDTGTIDAITVAQALHWFDDEETWTEFARVLRHGGGVGLIWNARDRSAEWVDRVWGIMDEVEKHAPWRDHDRPTGPAMGRARDQFGELQQATFFHEVPTDRHAMLDRVASVSHVAVLPEDRRRRVLDRVREALPDRDGLTVPYRTDVYATRRT